MSMMSRNTILLSRPNKTAILLLGAVILSHAPALALPGHELAASFTLPPRGPGSGSLTPGPDGWLWGVTVEGGASNAGTIYKVNPDGSAWRLVLSFGDNSTSNKGALPYGELLNDGAGSLWGTASEGGAGDFGTVFKVNAASGVLTTMVEFTGNAGIRKGAKPTAGLTSDGAGFLWGTTERGGNLDLGTVFRINQTTGVFTSVIEFSSNGASNKGAIPEATLVREGSFLWGTTGAGGSFDTGTVFKINTASVPPVLTTVIQFTGNKAANKGAYPSSGLSPAAGGFFWGTTQRGGAADQGTIFKIETATGTLETVAECSFEGGGISGAYPSAGLVNDGAGFFWGTTQYGGVMDAGTVFKVNAASGSVITVENFGINSGSHEGVAPSAPLYLDGQGFFWGTTYYGGSSNQGTVFRIEASTGTRTNIVQFDGDGQSINGLFPAAGLTSDGAGLLWGTAERGGSGGFGTLYKFNPAGSVVTTVTEFTGKGGLAPGDSPSGQLYFDGSGHFWGSTFLGGAPDLGTLFKVNAATGVLTNLADFTGDGGFNRGRNPRTSLISGGPGFLWGVSTRGGGPDDAGTIFKLGTAFGEMTPMLDFTGNDGARKGAGPAGGLVRDAAGNCWGTTERGGTGDFGTVFKYNPVSGTLTTVVEFTGQTGANKGAAPSAILLNDGAGTLWGTTSGGGVNTSGTIFKISLTTEALTTVVEFTGNGSINKGDSPAAGLLRDPAGDLYGTTTAGGASGAGTVFKLNPSSGALTTIAQFTGAGSQANTGSRPGYGTLVAHSDGHFYGTTTSGGPGGGGTIYRLRFGPTPVTVAATGVSNTTATLNGTLNPNGLATTASFEYGTNPSLANPTVVNAGTVAAGTTPRTVAANLSGLIANTTYYFRVRGLNAEHPLPQRGAVLSFVASGSGLTALQVWRQLHFGTTVNSGVAADTSDPDQDGIPNLAEFGFGLIPTRGTAVGLPQAQIIGSNFVIAFLTPAGVSGVTYGAEWSTSLTSTVWNPLSDTGSSAAHSFSVPVSTAPRLFVRLRVSTP